MNTPFHNRPIMRCSAMLAGCLCLCMLAGCGGGGASGTATPEISPAPGTMSLMAGTLGGPGNIDGTPGRLVRPFGIAVDRSGNFYVADSGAIRKVAPNGAVSTLAGKAYTTGSADGAGPQARFNFGAEFTGMAVDAAGNVYLGDRYNYTIRKISADGTVSTLAGTSGVSGSRDGTAAMAQFCSPAGLAMDPAGILYVADTCNRTIRKITPGGVVTTLAGNPAKPFPAPGTDGVGAAASFGNVAGIAVDAPGNVYVVDGVTIRKIAPGGMVTTLAGTVGMPGVADGIGAAARFAVPSGIAVDEAGTLFVTDAGALIRRISPAGLVTALAGSASGYADGGGSAARFDNPSGIVLAPDGRLVVADSNNYVIRAVTKTGSVATFAGMAGVIPAGQAGKPMEGSIDGVGAAAKFNTPGGMAVDGGGNVYVADTYNHLIRKIAPDGAVSTLAGGQGIAGSVDGVGAAARFSNPGSVAVDTAGNVYVAESSAVRKISAAGVVTTLAGAAGLKGSADGMGAAARFSGLNALAADLAGNLYAADTDNHVIRKISPSGAVTTFAGAAGAAGSNDGVGAAARFTFPRGVALDGAGNVYVSGEAEPWAPLGYSTGELMLKNRIRKISPAGAVTTIAGPETVGIDGPFSSTLASVAVDSNDNLYAVDASAIRRLSAAGQVTTIAGRPGSIGVMLGELPASLSAPRCVVAGANGVLYTLSENSVLRIQLR